MVHLLVYLVAISLVYHAYLPAVKGKHVPNLLQEVIRKQHCKSMATVTNDATFDSCSMLRIGLSLSLDCNEDKRSNDG